MTQAPATVVPLRPSRGRDELDDDALMGLVAGGDREAFACLVRRHQRAILSFATRAYGAVAAEELAQDAFVDLWGARGRYEGRGHFRAYLFTLLRNRAAKRGRRSSREASLVVAPPDPQQMPLEQLLEHERQAGVRRSIAALAPAHRDAIVLRFQEGFSYDEIARIVGSPAATVRSRVFHGLRALMRRLHGEHP